MDAKKRGPIGIELVKRGLINEDDINKALEYQREQMNILLLTQLFLFPFETSM